MTIYIMMNCFGEYLGAYKSLEEVKREAMEHEPQVRELMVAHEVTKSYRIFENGDIVEAECTPD